jgi:hypothetical protein
LNPLFRERAALFMPGLGVERVPPAHGGVALFRMSALRRGRSGLRPPRVPAGALAPAPDASRKFSAPKFENPLCPLSSATGL